MSTQKTNQSKTGSQPPLNAHITSVDCIQFSALELKNETEKSSCQLESDGYNIINTTQTRVTLHKARDNFDYFRKLREEAEGDHHSETMNSRERGQRRGRKHQSSIHVTEEKAQNNPRDTDVRRDALHIRDRLQVKSQLEVPIKDPILRPRSIAARNRLLQGCTPIDMKGDNVVSQDKILPRTAGIQTKNEQVDYGKENSDISSLQKLSSSQEYSELLPLRSDKFHSASTTQPVEPHSVINNGIGYRSRNLDRLVFEHEKHGFSNSPKTIMATKTLEGKQFQARAQLTSSANTLCGINKIYIENHNIDMLDKAKMKTDQPRNSCSTLMKKIEAKCSSILVERIYDDLKDFEAAKFHRS